MKQGKTQELAAAAAGMSMRTARSWQAGALPSQRRLRDWRALHGPDKEVYFEQDLNYRSAGHFTRWAWDT